MKKILIFAFWFGKLPNYFYLWIKTVKYNKNIDFIFFTDNYDIEDIPDNLKVINISFEEISEIVKKSFDVNIVLDRPYKLCEYRGGFAYIFPEYVKGYDFWGHCDIDIILGDLKHFFSNSILENYDKINTHAHLTLYRNSSKLNRMFMKKHKFSCYTFEEARKTKYICFLDEWGGISAYAPKYDVRQLDEVVYGDIDPFTFQFKLIRHKINSEHQIFEWNEGKLFLVYIDKINNSIKKEELEYIHLQKRKMNIAEELGGNFLIIPNKFIKYRELTVEKLIELTNDVNYNYSKAIKKNEIRKKINLLELKHKIFRKYKLIFFDNSCRPFVK